MSVSARMGSSAEEEVFDNIGQLNVEQLLEVHSGLGLSAIEQAQQTRGTLLKVIRRYLISEALEKSEDGGLSQILWIQTYLKGVLKRDVKVESNTSASSEGMTDATVSSGTSTQQVTQISSTSASSSTTVVQSVSTSPIVSTGAPSTSSLLSPPAPRATVDLADLKKASKKDPRYHW